MSRRRTLLVVVAVVACSALALGSVERSAGAVSDAPSSPVSWQSAGDSYSSGEGVFGNVGDCAQSDRAYGPLTADALRSRGWDISSETFTACTGHLVEDYFDERPDADGKASLWEWGRQQGGPDRVDVITMSFGGNDIGFADQIVDCLPVPDSWVGYIPIPPTLLSNFTGCDTSQREMEARIDALLDPPKLGCASSRRTGNIDFECDLDIGERRGSIIDFYYDIVTQRLTADGQLYVVGYPRIFAPVDQWPGWVKVSCQGVLRGDTEKLGRIADHFNAKLIEAVGRANQALGTDRVHFVDRLSLYADGAHELCGTGVDWLNGVAFDRGDGSDRRKETSFHPNAAGHEAVATRLADLVAATFTGPQVISPDRRSGSTLVDCDAEVSDDIGEAIFARCSGDWATGQAVAYVEGGCADCDGVTLFHRVAGRWTENGGCLYRSVIIAGSKGCTEMWQVPPEVLCEVWLNSELGALWETGCPPWLDSLERAQTEPCTYYGELDPTDDDWGPAFGTCRKGLLVQQVQRRLVELGYTVDVDGFFGPQSARAIAHFQRAQGLTVSAVIDPPSIAALVG